MSDNKDIRSLIYTVRGQQVMLDSDLAKLYKVETKVFNQAVNRNLDRFPDNFRFQLTKEEFDALRSQIATSNGKSGRRCRPYMFAEQGIAMLSGVLRSDEAVQMSIRIMNAFVEMRLFGISLMKDNEIVIELLNRLKTI
ncbi:MAG: ORF6N domain-containing protein [Candidatus Ornithospirochaeta sp.]